MTQPANQARQARNWQNLAELSLWIASLFGTIAAIAVQPLFALFLPLLLALGMSLLNRRRDRQQMLQQRHTTQKQVSTAISKLEGKIQQNFKQIEQMSALIAQFQEAQPQQTHQVQQQSLQSAIASLQAQVKDNQTKINQIPKLESLDAHISTLEAIFQSITHQNEAWQADLAALQHQVANFAEIPNQIAVFSEALRRLETDFQANRHKESEIHDLSDTIANLQALQAQLQDSSQQNTQIFQTAIARVEQQSEDYIKLCQQVEALRATIGHFEHRIQKISQTTPSETPQLTEYREQLQDIANAVATLQSQHQETRNAIAKVNNKNAKRQTQVATQLKQIQDRLDRLQSQFDRAVESLEQLPRLQEVVANLQNYAHLEDLTPIQEAIANLKADLAQNEFTELQQPSPTQQRATSKQQWRLLHRIDTNSSGLKALAIAPDNQIVASEGENYSIQLFSLETGQLIQSLAGHNVYLQALAFSPDSQILASCSVNKTIKLWDIQTGQLKHNLVGHSDVVYSIAFSSDGQLLASGGKDNTVRLWNTATGKLIRTLTGHWQKINAIAFSPDGVTLASGSILGTAKIWNIASGELISDCLLASGINDLAYSPNGRILYAACDNKTIKCLDVQTQKQKTALVGHNDVVLSVAISPDGTTAASSSRDGFLQLWSLDSSQKIIDLQQENAAITVVRFSDNGCSLVSACEAGFLKIWTAI
jgi:hypothetical protein